jgi:membrane fusion protein, heavy metal efflux system
VIGAARALLVLGALAAATSTSVTMSGCKRRPGGGAEQGQGARDPHEGHHDEGHHDDDQHAAARAGDGGAHAAVAAGTPGLLRVDPGMVRDLRITTARVESRPGGDGVTLLGELEPDQDAYAEVGSPIDGRVIRLAAAAGDVVKAGAPLAEVESAALGRARAAEVTARAQAQLARQVAERKRQLAAEGIAAGRELDEAEAAARAADADLTAARATLQAFGAVVSGTGARLTLRAPVAGTVLERKVARGQVVGPAETLFRIADLAEVWLTVQAFERDALRVTLGAPARVTFPALPGRTFAGKVTWVASQVEVRSRTIPVRVTVHNQGAVLRPGMSASAWLPVAGGGAAVVAVPMAALQRLDREWVVFVPGRDSHSFEVRKVGRGRDLGGEVEILSALRAGETVVVDGAFLLKAEAEKARGMGEHHEH